MKPAQELLDKAYQLGFEYEKTYRGCSQCAIAAIQDTLTIRDDSVFKASTGLAGGGGLTGTGICGGYAGGILVIGQLLGRERSNFEDPEGVRYQNLALVRKFLQQYIQELGSIICRDIQLIKFGRPYYIADEQDYQRFEQAGAHEEKCPHVVGTASQLAVRLILEEGLIPFSK